MKSHANTVELELIVRIPKVHVSPRRGSKMIEAMNNDLCIIIRTILKIHNIYFLKLKNYALFNAVYCL